ncbi:MAG: DUF2807 domain-containing protein [Tenuifilaceae bacterium]|jgi:hypothetical protein|nr:DUF2807 domain-containing protein [Bacteroidales bacterium]MDI9517252.1 DUF2807 domain-containing protein [Bacteroidota bacterium]NLH57062.1 hypothetical protein [Rikenellaceae bacterium]OQC61090.1 MAG: hypothetical protein BWX49_02357 [Bacteroidetes bacterium ADurb.Bin008]HNV81696.1 DUF2807 domain-containing protein [Tenuifilaceae bacterium]
MKTSNLLLLIAFVVLVILSVVGIYVVKTNLEEYLPQQGEAFSTQKELLPFGQIKVEGTLTIEFVQDTICQLSVQADSATQEKIQVSVLDDVLSIKLERRISKGIQCELRGPMFSKLSVSAGSTFRSSDSLSSPALDLTANAGAIINLRGKFGLVNAELNAGSTLKMEGEGDSIDITANAGSTVKMKKFASQKASVKANSGSEIAINSVTIEASASSGAAVHYNEDALLKSENTSSGGRIWTYSVKQKK